MKSEQLILVNNNDEPIGTMEKMEVHEKGLLHRAFSIFIFDSEGRLLLQQRAQSKYHSSGLWTNTCCSHPRADESLLVAANRRLNEEMGFNTELKEIFSFIYKAEMENGLVEHEFDHVFAGIYDGTISPDPNEVQSWRYRSIEELKEQIKKTPQLFTIWFRIAFDKIEEWWTVNFKNKKSWSY